MNQNYSGKLILLKKEYSFNFDGSKLSVTIDDEEEIRELLWTKIGETYAYCGMKELPSAYIYGKIDQTGNPIHFQIKTDRYSCNDLFALHGTTKIEINVLRYMIINPDRQIDGTCIFCLSKYFHKFLGIIPDYKRIDDEHNENTIAEIDVNRSAIKKVGRFVMDGIEFEIHPDFKWVVGLGKFELTPELLIKTEKELEIECIWKIYRCFCHIIQFLFLRTNIFPDEFIVRTKDLKLEIFERDWDLPEEEPEQINNILKNYVVRWNEIFQHIDRIGNDYSTEDNNINFFLYEKRIDRFLFDRTSISLDCAAFESAFSKVYPDISLHDEKTKLIYEEAKAEVDKLIKNSTGKKRDIFKGLIKQVDHYSLETKMQYAFKDNIGSFKLFDEKMHGDVENKYKEIAHTCATVRNDIDHGNEGLIIDDIVSKSMMYLRALILAMYLKRWGLTSEEIKSSIDNVFN